MISRIGIPCGLFYYQYQRLWLSFFEYLDIDPVLSGDTNHRIQDLGLRHCINEACLPVKVYFGHVLELKEKVDALFIPRFTSIHKREYICPKFGGLPDMVKSSLEGLPPIINTEINQRNKDNMKNTLFEIAEELGVQQKDVQQAYSHALNDYFRSRNEEISTSHNNDGLKNILLLGHPYLIHDAFVNMGIMDKIKAYNVNVLTLESYDHRKLRESAKSLRKPLFWSYGTYALGLAYRLIEQGNVDGIIYLSSFGCGIDSFVGYMIERRIRSHTRIPYTMITLDEHSAEAGINTRLEAFMDTIQWSKNYGCHLPAYG